MTRGDELAGVRGVRGARDEGGFADLEAREATCQSAKFPDTSGGTLDGRRAGVSEETIGDRLEALREAVGLEFRRDFADTFETSEPVYSKIVSGQRALTVERALRVGKRYGVTLDYVYTGNLAGVPEAYREQVSSFLSARAAERRKRSGDQA